MKNIHFYFIIFFCIYLLMWVHATSLMIGLHLIFAVFLAVELFNVPTIEEAEH